MMSPERSSVVARRPAAEDTSNESGGDHPMHDDRALSLLSYRNRGKLTISSAQVHPVVSVGYTLNHNPDYDPGIRGYACEAMRAILQRSGVIRIGPE